MRIQPDELLREMEDEIARLRREKAVLVEAIREYVSADDKITDDENTERAATRLSDAIDGLRAALRSATEKGEPT